MNTMYIKRTAAFAAVAAAVCAVQFGCQSQADAAPNPKDYFKPDIQYVDGTNTFTGPARGYAAGGAFPENDSLHGRDDVPLSYRYRRRRILSRIFANVASGMGIRRIRRRCCGGGL